MPDGARTVPTGAPRFVYDEVATPAPPVMSAT